MGLYDLHPFLAASMSLFILLYSTEYLHSYSTTASTVETIISLLLNSAPDAPAIPPVPATTQRLDDRHQAVVAANERRRDFEQYLWFGCSIGTMNCMVAMQLAWGLLPGFRLISGSFLSPAGLVHWDITCCIRSAVL